MRDLEKDIVVESVAGVSSPPSDLHMASLQPVRIKKICIKNFHARHGIFDCALPLSRDSAFGAPELGGHEVHVVAIHDAVDVAEHVALAVGEVLCKLMPRLREEEEEEPLSDKI